jgi:AraC-like DNA-binding protein
LSTIGNLVGYENYPPFFSMFKKIVGISPNEYRTQINNFPKTYDNGLFESNLE